ncbi:hypothetical protein LguiA_021853 [Lonicera macranthoides]
MAISSLDWNRRYCGFVPQQQIPQSVPAIVLPELGKKSYAAALKVADPEFLPSEVDVSKLSVPSFKVEIAFSKGWTRIWFEMDSALTFVNFFNPFYLPLWQLCRRQERCLSMLKRMEFRASHIYREGNVPADILSNMALVNSDFTWWSHDISVIRRAVMDDMLGEPKYRFC